MRITEDVRKFAAQHGISEEAALEAGLKEKAKEFAQRDLTPTGRLDAFSSALSNY